MHIQRKYINTYIIQDIYLFIFIVFQDILSALKILFNTANFKFVVFISRGFLN